MDQYKDDFIRKLVAGKNPVRAPEGFTEKVMERLTPETMESHEPLLSPMAWGAIFVGITGLVITLFFVDIPFINNFFSSTGIGKLSLDIFSAGFYDSFIRFFKELNINAVAIVIAIAFVSLIVVERIISKRRSQHRLVLL